MRENNEIFSLNIPDSEKPRVVIVGGGFGGLHFLKKIDKKQFQVVMLDRYNYHTFQPLLYQVATAGLEPDSVAGPLRKVIQKYKNVYFRMLKVDAVNTAENKIRTTAGELEYDYLVLATGAKINFFGNEDIARHSFPLKQVTHALDLRSHIFQQFERLEILCKSQRDDRLLNFVIVGAGPTGVEVCGALAELKRHVLPKDYPDLDISRVKIYLVEGLDNVLPAMSERAGRKAQHYLEKLGVKIILGSMIEEYDGKTAKLSIGKEIETNTLIWAAGVQGNLPKGFSENSVEKSKLMINSLSQVYRQKEDESVFGNVFAIGDVAFMKTKEYEKGLPGLAQAAIQQGEHVAKTLNGLRKNEKPQPFEYKNKGVLATVGRNKAIADLPNNMKVSGFVGWFLWMVVHLLFLVGFRSKAVVLANWIWNYFTYDRSIRLILRPSTKNSDKISREMQVEMKES